MHSSRADSRDSRGLCAYRERDRESVARLSPRSKKHSSKGLGVVSLGSKMIDPPVVQRALKLVARAQAMGMLSSEVTRPAESFMPVARRMTELNCANAAGRMRPGHGEWQVRRFPTWASASTSRAGARRRRRSAPSRLSRERRQARRRPRDRAAQVRPARWHGDLLAPSLCATATAWR